MLVFADRERRVSPAEQIAALAAEVGAGLLTDAFVRACELAQGLIDAQFARRGADELTPTHGASLALLLDLAYRLQRPAAALFDNPLAGQALPPWVMVRTAEGFAHYGVEPQTFLAAGARLSAATVIGLRSIGAGLAALVAAGCGATRLFSLRPVGDPYRRQLSVTPALEVELLCERQGLIAVVDEGPGRSGSSFAAVAQWLFERGVEPARLVFLTSHAGEPGPAADDAIRAVWRATRRITADASPAGLALAATFEDLIGPPMSPPEDLSGGLWRQERSDAPPASPLMERRKLRVQTRSGRFLMKFAGLGPAPRGKLERALALHTAEFASQPLALRHGFLLERWLDAAPAQDLGAGDLAGIGAYLGFRAARFPARTCGASLAMLAEMARQNIGEALGSASAAAALAPFPLSRLAALERQVRPVEIDGRMHRWEWLRADGRLLKTDALDHADGHDLVGAQDIAWDVAGAGVELGLDVARLIAAMPAATRPAAELVAFARIAYLGFQLGLWSFAPQDDAVAALLNRYRALLTGDRR